MILAIKIIRDSDGMTLPFALILTFIFSALVSVSFLFVSLNLNQMQSSLQEAQAISIAEGFNEKIKARLNTKSKIPVSPQQEEKLKVPSGEDDEDDEDLPEDDFDENTEDFDEYYADEILKISRYITFKEPPEEPEAQGNQALEEGITPTQDSSSKPEANVEMIGSISIPQGTVLSKGTMIIIYKDEKISLMLEDIVPENKIAFKEKLPVPVIKSLSPNYAEPNKRGSFVVIGDNLSYNQKARFSNKDITIEDIRSGPLVEFLIKAEAMAGLTKFYWEGTQAEFYIVPIYDGSPRPTINQIKVSDDKDLLEIKAGQKRTVTMIYGVDLFLKKSPPVVITDFVGITPTIKGTSPDGKDLTVTLDIDKKVEPGVHSIIVATEGGLSNSWLFNVLPPDENQVDLSSNVATVTSSLTLLNIKPIENLLPLIDEGEDLEEEEKSIKDDEDEVDNDEPEDEEDFSADEIPEKKKLGKFANADLETEWLVQTSVMVGKTTRTISEVVQRQVPNIYAAVATNSEVTFDGGGFQFAGQTTAMTKLIEPTYISNSILSVEGLSEEEKASTEPATNTSGGQEQNTSSGGGRPEESQNIQKSPEELGFIPNSFIAVYKENERSIDDFDYSLISKVGDNTIELYPPGLMSFHYEGDLVSQFIPPLISKSMISTDIAEKHLVPKEFSISLEGYATAKNTFKSNLKQLAELADLYTDDISVPSDEFGTPIGYMGLSYIDGTAVFDNTNTLIGKGILIIDTRNDNQGKPIGDVEFAGDSKNPITFSGLVYVHGNLRIDGNVTITGGLIVDNESNGMVQITNNALGKIIWDPNAIRQTLLYTPFTTRLGTVMISNKPIDLTGYIQSGTSSTSELGASPVFSDTTIPGIDTSQSQGVKAPDLPPEEALVETAKEAEENKQPDYFPSSQPRKSAEEELIDLF